MKSEIRLHNGKQVLYVDDAPFFAVAGEVHNSDSSSPEYMEKIWKKIFKLINFYWFYYITVGFASLHPRLNS